MRSDRAVIQDESLKRMPGGRRVLDRFFLSILSMVFWLGFVTNSSFATTSFDQRLDATDRLNGLLRRELSKRFQTARIDITSSVRWIQGKLPAQVDSINILGENGRGEVQ